MTPFEKILKKHPTPWRISRTLDGAVRFVADANGNPVTMEIVVAMMNAAVEELKLIKYDRDYDKFR